jgi:hypothetical protein
VSLSDEGKARRMCRGGVIEGEGEVQRKPARAVAPETRLARLMERELHLAAPFAASSSPVGAKSRLWLTKSTMKASNPMVNDEATKVTK